MVPTAHRWIRETYGEESFKFEDLFTKPLSKGESIYKRIFDVCTEVSSFPTILFTSTAIAASMLYDVVSGGELSAANLSNSGLSYAVSLASVATNIASAGYELYRYGKRKGLEETVRKAEAAVNSKISA